MKQSLEILYHAWAEEPRREADKARKELEEALDIVRDDALLQKLFLYEELIMGLAFEAGFSTARELLK